MGCGSSVEDSREEGAETASPAVAVSEELSDTSAIPVDGAAADAGNPLEAPNFGPNADSGAVPPPKKFKKVKKVKKKLKRANPAADGDGTCDDLGADTPDRSRLTSLDDSGEGALAGSDRGQELGARRVASPADVSEQPDEEEPMLAPTSDFSPGTPLYVPDSLPSDREHAFAAGRALSPPPQILPSLSSHMLPSFEFTTASGRLVGQPLADSNPASTESPPPSSGTGGDVTPRADGSTVAFHSSEGTDRTPSLLSPTGRVELPPLGTPRDGSTRHSSLTGSISRPTLGGSLDSPTGSHCITYPTAASSRRSAETARTDSGTVSKSPGSHRKGSASFGTLSGRSDTGTGSSSLRSTLDGSSCRDSAA